MTTNRGKAILECIAINKNTQEEARSPKRDLHLFSREDFNNPLVQIILQEIRKIGEQSRDWSVCFRCSCSGRAIMNSVRKPKKKDCTLRDKQVGQHDHACPLYKPITYKDSVGKKAALTEEILKMPNKNKSAKKSCKSKVATKAVVDSNKRETINGMIFTTLELASVLSNERFENFTWNGFEKTLYKQILDMPYEATTFRSCKDDSAKRGKKIYVDILLLNELKVSAYKSVDTMKLNESLVAKLERCPGSLFKIDGMYNYVRGDILLSAINGLKIFNGYITGPFVMLAIKVKEKKGTFYQIPRLFVHPVHVGEKYISPVESDMERQCISVLDGLNEIKFYKPTSRQNDIFKSQLQSFLADVPLAKKEYFKAMKVYADEENGAQIRPDLFVKYKGNVLVFEIAGMMNVPKYKKHLEKKEKQFYSQLSSIRYHRVESVKEMQLVMERYL